MNKEENALSTVEENKNKLPDSVVKRIKGLLSVVQMIEARLANADNKDKTKEDYNDWESVVNDILAVAFYSDKKIHRVNDFNRGRNCYVKQAVDGTFLVFDEISVENDFATCDISNLVDKLIAGGIELVGYSRSLLPATYDLTKIDMYTLKQINDYLTDDKVEEIFDDLRENDGFLAYYIKTDTHEVFTVAEGSKKNADRIYDHGVRFVCTRAPKKLYLNGDGNPDGRTELAIMLAGNLSGFNSYFIDEYPELSIDYWGITE